jgi:hypothetical protein
MTKLSSIIVLFLISLCLCDQQQDIKNLARTIYAEARGEGHRGMDDVAATIVNSYNLNRPYMGGHDWSKIVQIGYEGFKTPEPHPTSAGDIASLQYATKLANDIVNHKIVDTVNGATHFATYRDKYRSKEQPGKFVYLFKRGHFYFWREY